MKLYTVSVSYDFVVVAKDISEAYQVGQENVRDALSDMSSRDVDLHVVSGVHADGWDDRCIPYGGDGDITIGEYRELA